MALRFSRLALVALASAAFVGQAQAITFVNSIAVPTDTADKSGDPAGANGNRVGMFSDLAYDPITKTYYALSDRGPGGGSLNSETRAQKFKLDVNATTGAISNFKITETVKFTSAGSNFNGLNPGLLNGDKAVIGLSHDPEGIVLSSTKTLFVADEYGPSVHEFAADGTLLRTLATPANLIPKLGNGTVNYVDGRGTIVTGRQDNRGFEGITISPDGTKLYAIMQDPLVHEGTDGDGNLTDGEGRRSRNLRVVEFSVATGLSTAQYIYQLEALADINDRIAGTAQDFAATAQGRSIGASSITALNDHEFLVIERDNRGVGVDPATNLPVGTKRVYKIDLAGASDFAAFSLNDTNTLPAGKAAAAKSLFLDIQAALVAQGLPIPEKLEGLTFGPVLADGGMLLLIGTDNDYSVSQVEGLPTQYDAWISDTGTGRTYRFTPLGDTSMSYGNLTDTTLVDLGALPTGFTQIPGYLYAFKLSADEVAALNLQAQYFVPEPATAALGLAGALAFAARRRRSH